MGRIQYFRHSAVSLSKIHRGTRWRRRRARMCHRSLVVLMFPSKVEPWPSKNRSTSILKTDSNLAPSKTFITTVSFKSIEFGKLMNKSFHTNGHFENLNVSRIFAEKSFPYVQLDEKPDGDAAQPIWLTVPELHLAKNGAQFYQIRCHYIFTGYSNSVSCKTPTTVVSSSSNEFGKLSQKMLSLL